MVCQLSEKIKFLVLTTLFVLVYAKHEEYIGWKSYYVRVSTKEQVKNLNVLSIKLDLDFLSRGHQQREAVVLVKPEHQEEFIKNLDNLGIKYKVHTEDIKSRLDHDDKIMKDLKKFIVRNGGTLMPYNNYQRLNVIYDYMTYISTKYQNITTLVTTGPSFEGRPIKYMKISTTNFQDKHKPVIFIDGCIHAREWITPPTVTWAIRKLTEDLTEPDLLKHYDWILIPVVNPDGYEFTFTHYRFWRKTLSTDTHFNSSICPGVDGNRNYDVVWNTVDTNDNPCSPVYGGDRAFSEIETRVVRDLLQEHLARIALYISMHSFGSMILIPWGYKNYSSHNKLALNSVGVDMADAIYNIALQNFPRYLVGNPGSVIGYQCSGTSTDYAHSIGVPLTYTFELPGFAMKSYEGFNLEPKYIEQVCRETWAGIAVGARRAKQLLKK